MVLEGKEKDDQGGDQHSLTLEEVSHTWTKASLTMMFPGPWCLELLHTHTRAPLSWTSFKWGMFFSFVIVALIPTILEVVTAIECLLSISPMVPSPLRLWNRHTAQCHSLDQTGEHSDRRRDQHSFGVPFALDDSHCGDVEQRNARDHPEDVDRNEEVNPLCPEPATAKPPVGQPRDSSHRKRQS